jgi:hypothetical protein
MELSGVRKRMLMVIFDRGFALLSVWIFQRSIASASTSTSLKGADRNRAMNIATKQGSDRGEVL